MIFTVYVSVQHDLFLWHAKVLSSITFSIFLNILAFSDHYSVLSSFVLENYAQLFTDLALGLGLLAFFLLVCMISLVIASNPYPVSRVAAYALEISFTMT